LITGYFSGIGKDPGGIVTNMPQTWSIPPLAKAPIGDM